jgi:hypothetical protein
MLKCRYFQLRLPCSFNELMQMASDVLPSDSAPDVSIVRKLKGQIILQTSFTRYLSTRMIAPGGEVIVNSIPTIDTYHVKIFEVNKKHFLCCNDPPRGAKFVQDLLSNLLRSDRYFFESIELDQALISAYIKNFNTAKLVSAKVRDFHVYGNAVGRLEISCYEGLMDGIAPFLYGKHYKVDAFTYAISHGLCHGLIYFSKNGTLRISDSLKEVAIPLFERVLGEADL